MTHRERFLKVLDFDHPDRVPNYELGAWGQTYQRWLDEGMPEDMMHGPAWFEGEPHFGMERRGFAAIDIKMNPLFPSLVLEETATCVVARNGHGIVTKALKEGTVRGTRLCMDQYISFPVTDRKSFTELTRSRYNPASAARYPLWWDEWTRIWQNRDYPLCLLNNGTFGLYSQLRSWVGTENISYLFYDDPAFVQEMIEFNTDFMLQVVEKALTEVHFDYFNFFEDLSGKGGPLISPDIFRRFFMPSYQKIIGCLRRAGIRHFWFDSDGDCEVLIPLLIETGITCLWPLEQASGMNPVRLRKKFGRDIAFAGGIDKLELAKDRKGIERELEAKIPPLLESGGYIPHLDHTFSPEISYDNFHYYLELKQKMLDR